MVRRTYGASLATTPPWGNVGAPFGGVGGAGGTQSGTMPGGPPVWNWTAWRLSVRWISAPSLVSSARVVTSSR